MRNSLIGPQSKKMSNQQNTLDPTRSIHKKTRGKVWPQKNWFWWRGLSLKFRCHFLIQTSPLNPKKKPQELLPLKSDFWPFCMFLYFDQIFSGARAIFVLQMQTPLSKSTILGSNFFHGFLKLDPELFVNRTIFIGPRWGKASKKKLIKSGQADCLGSPWPLFTSFFFMPSLNLGSNL